MAEHGEAPKNQQNRPRKSDGKYQPLWDTDPARPDYSALLLHGTPVSRTNRGDPEPVKEVMEIQRLVLHRACRYGYTRPDSAQSRCAPILQRPLCRFLPRTLCAGCKLFPSATGAQC